MTHLFTGHPTDIYQAQLKDLLDAPEVTVKGRPTRELLNVITEISPLNCVQIVPGRKLNPWLALSEGLALIAGSNLVRHLEPYNKRITEFSDNGKTFYGSYGWRIMYQIPPLIQRLRVEASDRRALLVIWEPEDLWAETKDAPCNDLVMFKIRDEKLHMTVINRSNDLHWGLHAVNLPEFAILQQYLAMHLEVGLGRQTHLSNSLHLYMDGPHIKLTKDMLEAMDEPIEYLETPFLFPNKKEALEEAEHTAYARICRDILDGESAYDLPFFQFASEFLAAYRNRHKHLSKWYLDIAHTFQFQPWIDAGDAFLG